jgi:hypothetical protein
VNFLKLKALSQLPMNTLQSLIKKKWLNEMTDEPQQIKPRPESIMRLEFEEDNFNHPGTISTAYGSWINKPRSRLLNNEIDSINLGD